MLQQQKRTPDMMTNMTESILMIMVVINTMVISKKKKMLNEAQTFIQYLSKQHQQKICSKS
jgi:accessory colonization factor AcfC